MSCLAFTKINRKKSLSPTKSVDVCNLLLHHMTMKGLEEKRKEQSKKGPHSCVWHFHNYSFHSIGLNDCNFHVFLGLRESEVASSLFIMRYFSQLKPIMDLSLPAHLNDNGRVTVISEGKDTVSCSLSCSFSKDRLLGECHSTTFKNTNIHFHTFSLTENFFCYVKVRIWPLKHRQNFLHWSN